MNRLDRAYAMVPEIACRGLCAEACGPVVPSNAEAERLMDRHGVVIGIDRTLTCTLLHEGRCSVYPDRPLICRLWGVVREMPCVFGCRPVGGTMSSKDERKAMNLVYGRIL